MKILFPFLLLMMAAVCNAQTDTALTYSNIVQVDSGLKANELYNRALTWIAENYKDSKSVLEVQDKEAGELIGKGALQYKGTYYLGSSIGGWVNYELKILVKDGRYKFVFTDFIHTGTYYNTGTVSFGLITTAKECPKSKWPNMFGQNMATRAWDDIKNTIQNNMIIAMQSLQKAMNKPANKSDW